MNYVIISYILVFLMIKVRSQSNVTCDTPYTDIKNNKIVINDYCDGKTCIVKCCGENEVFFEQEIGNETILQCKDAVVLKGELNMTITGDLLDYSDLDIYKNDIYKSKEVSSKKFKDFTLLQSEMFRYGDCATNLGIAAFVSEKGYMVIESPNHYEYWMHITMLNFCVEKLVSIVDGDLDVSYAINYKNEDETKLDYKNSFTAIGMLISAFFLLLVLVVYLILPPLRNIQGMLLAAYVATLMCTYIIKGSSLLYDDAGDSEQSVDCTVRTQITYYCILASFFWLKLMSYDIWWTFRGSRKHRAIHRRGITVKFLIYACYAYGVPALITIFAVYMDAQDLAAHIAKPFFDQCFMTDTLLYYLYVPLMILTGCNCLLFLMTMYNIWLIKRNMASFDKNTVNKNKKNQNTFLLYIKLCSLMGVAWILEFIQVRLVDDDLPVWLYIALNSYNVFIGPIIFFMFVFKRKIFLMLCKRFDIENKWTRRMYKVASTTRSVQSSKASKTYSRTRSTESDAEEALRKEDNSLLSNTTSTTCV